MIHRWKCVGSNPDMISHLLIIADQTSHLQTIITGSGQHLKWCSWHCWCPSYTPMLCCHTSGLCYVLSPHSATCPNRSQCWAVIDCQLLAKCWATHQTSNGHAQIYRTMTRHNCVSRVDAATQQLTKIVQQYQHPNNNLFTHVKHTHNTYLGFYNSCCCATHTNNNTRDPPSHTTFHPHIVANQKQVPKSVCGQTSSPVWRNMQTPSGIYIVWM